MDFNGMDMEERALLATKSNDYNELKELANDDEPLIREIIARRKDIPSDILDELARDPSRNVRVAVACNIEGASPEALKYLSNDSEFEVKHFARMSKSVKKDLLKKELKRYK